MSRYHFDGDLAAEWRRMVTSQPTGHPPQAKPRYGSRRAQFQDEDWTEPKWSRFVLLHDAHGRSLMYRVWEKLRRSA